MQGEKSPRTDESVDESDENRKKPTMTLSETDQNIVRLIGQHLREIGLDRTADQLVAESGCPMEDTEAANLRTQVMNGNWEKAHLTVERMKRKFPSSDDKKVRFLLLEQEFLEHLDDGKALEALSCLRSMSPLQDNSTRVHQLATYLMFGSQQELRKVSCWGGKGKTTRRNVLTKVYKCLPPSYMLPPRRLQILLDQAVDLQRKQCRFHNSSVDNDPEGVRYLADHCCDQDQFPLYTTKVLTEHVDEVWYCAFSPDGRKLATGSRDSFVNIYLVNLETHDVKYQNAFGHGNVGVSFFAWSPDSSHLIVCGQEVPRCPEVWIYNINKRALHKRMCHSVNDSLTCAAWLSDSYRFVTGSTQGQFFLCNMDGDLLKRWEGVRLQGLCCLPGSDMVLGLDNQRRVRSYAFLNSENHTLFQEDHPVISFCVNKAGTMALLNVASQGVHLWDLKECVLLQKFRGMIHGHFITYSSFGGHQDEFIACGSEETSVLIYNIRDSTPVAELVGHSAGVNCAHWNPMLPSMLASASDDGTVRIWGPKSKEITGEDI